MTMMMIASKYPLNDTNYNCLKYKITQMNTKDYPKSGARGGGGGMIRKLLELVHQHLNADL